MRMPTTPTAGSMMPTPPTPAYQPISQLLASGDTSYESLLGCVNSVPFEPKYLGDLGLFDYQSETANPVVVEFDGQVINLVQTSQPGSPGQAVDYAPRKTQAVNAPRIAVTITVLPSEVAGVREVGGVQLETLETRADRKLKNAVRNIRSTMEWHRLKAAQGRLLDANGSTINDYYSLFGISEPVYSLAVGTSTTDFIGVGEDLLNMEEDALGELDWTVKPIALLGRTLFKSFVTHPNVKDAYRYFQSNQKNNPNRDDIRYEDFEHGGIIWRQYRGNANTVGRFLADNEGRVLIPGVAGSYIGAFCPPTDIKEFVNTPGLPLYMTVKELDHGGGWEIRVQSNPLHVMARPAAAIKLTA